MILVERFKLFQVFFLNHNALTNLCSEINVNIKMNKTLTFNLHIILRDRVRMYGHQMVLLTSDDVAVSGPR